MNGAEGEVAQAMPSEGVSVSAPNAKKYRLNPQAVSFLTGGSGSGMRSGRFLQALSCIEKFMQYVINMIFMGSGSLLCEPHECCYGIKRGVGFFFPETPPQKVVLS
jgi:hypothetical protein